MTCEFGSSLVHSSLVYCPAALCSDPDGIDHGNVTFTGNSVDDTATYTCNSSFELIGNANTTCTQLDMYTAMFSQEPFCRREYEYK